MMLARTTKRIPIVTPHVLDFVWSLYARFRQWRNVRRDWQGLAELLKRDDSLLQDIGISRTEVEVALTRSDPDDAADYLTRCRHGRPV